MNKKSVVIALGGNALSPKGDDGSIKNQFRHTINSMQNIMHFVRKNYNICITHGNGPQVGDELRRHEIASKKIPPLPLGVLVANTQGAIGYMIQQSLQNALYNENSKREVVSFISQMKVDRNDPAIKQPSKFIGKVQGKIMALFDDLGNLIADFWTEGIANPRTWRNMLIGLLGPEAGAAAAATFGLSKESIQEKETAKRQEMEDRISKIPKLIAEYEKELEDNTKNYTGAQRRFMASEIERLKSEKERNEDKIENINTLHMMDNAKDELAKRNLEFQLKEGIDLTKLQEEATAAQKEYNEFMAGKTKSFTGQTIDANVGGYEFFVEAENDKRRAIRLHRAKVEGLVQDAIGLTDTQLEEKSLAELLVLLQSSLKGKSATVQKDTIEDIMTGEGWLSPEQHKQQLESLIVQQKQLEAEAKQKLLAPQQALAAAMSKMDTAEAAVMIDLLQKTGSVTGATLNNLQRQTGQGSSTVFVDNSVKSASTSNATIPMITNPVIPGDSSGLLSPSGG